MVSFQRGALRPGRFFNVTWDDLAQDVASDLAETAGSAWPSAADGHGAGGLSPRPRAVFLHTQWRSGGTWIWSRCRDWETVCGFYEPLHEQASRFRRPGLTRLQPASWRSGHSETAPYFEEFRPLIPQHGRGVTLYQDRFAFDQFFLSPDAPEDAALEAYLHSLVAHAGAMGRMPVLKFCRSVGRTGWMQARFPDAAHFVVLRDPVSQYLSIRGLMEKQRNRYFAVAPLLVLARNAATSGVREAVAAFGLSLPTLHSPDMAYQVETCWRHIRRLPEDERYRTFLAFWTLASGYALNSTARVIDMQALGADPLYRARVETDLRLASGAEVDLSSWRASPAPDLASIAGAPDAHAAALHLLVDHCRLSPARLAVLSGKLESAGSVQRRRIYLPARVAQPRCPASLQTLATAGAVLAARAMQPLRRLHGALAWHLPLV